MYTHMSDDDDDDEDEDEEKAPPYARYARYASTGSFGFSYSHVRSTFHGGRSSERRGEERRGEERRGFLDVNYGVVSYIENRIYT